jgi:hypothetical protein
MTTMLRSAGTTWSAATVGAQGAAGLELSSGTAVMALGGFTGSDAAPTLAQFQQWVAQGKVHYFVSGGDGHGPGGGGPGGAAGRDGRGGGPGGGGPGAPGPGGENGVGSQISTWVKAHYSATTVGGYPVYDLTAAGH